MIYILSNFLGMKKINVTIHSRIRKEQNTYLKTLENKKKMNLLRETMNTDKKKYITIHCIYFMIMAFLFILILIRSFYSMDIFRIYLLLLSNDSIDSLVGKINSNVPNTSNLEVLDMVNQDKKKKQNFSIKNTLNYFYNYLNNYACETIAEQLNDLCALISENARAKDRVNEDLEQAENILYKIYYHMKLLFLKTFMYVVSIARIIALCVLLYFMRKQILLIQNKKYVKKDAIKLYLDERATFNLYLANQAKTKQQNRINQMNKRLKEKEYAEICHSKNIPSPREIKKMTNEIDRIIKKYNKHKKFSKKSQDNQDNDVKIISSEIKPQDFKNHK